jgi:hypothetical protein
VNKSDNESDRILWDPTILRKSYRNPGEDPRDGSVALDLPRSNMHGRKRPFTEKNGDIRRSYTVSVHGHRIRSETVRNGFRIRRSYKNTE